jgi:hypothetical protein
MTDPGSEAPAPAPSHSTPLANAAEPSTRLNELKADTAWRDRYLAGGLVEARQINELHEAMRNGDNPDVDRAMAGILDDGPIQRSEHMQMIAVAQWMKEKGLRDEVIREALAGKGVTQQKRDAVERLKADRMRDHAWTKEFMAGNGQHVRDMTLMNIVLTSSIKKDAAA